MIYRKFKSRNAWWTKERVILGLQRFYKDFGFCPTDQGHYSAKQQFTGKIINGRSSTQGWNQKYPSMYAVFKFFDTMRDAWTAAGFDVDRGYQEWSPIEDWFIVESCGILPRDEVGRILKRTTAAVKRRLYDLGRFKAKTRWGITVHKAETLMGISGQVISRYIRHGVIPVFRGNQFIYLNPADLVKIVEFDWTNPDIDPELERLVRLSLIQRALKILKFREAWRTREIYKFESKEVYHGRVRSGGTTPLLKNTPAAPNDLKTDDWVIVTENHNRNLKDRRGQIKNVFYSWQKVKRKDGTRRECWMARVEFPKLRVITGEKSRRIHYSLPLDNLTRTVPPVIEKPPLKQTPEAIRGRERFQKHLLRAGARLEEIKEELT